jgi:hypothetical protein
MSKGEASCAMGSGRDGAGSGAFFGGISLQPFLRGALQRIFILQRNSPFCNEKAEPDGHSKNGLQPDQSSLQQDDIHAWRVLLCLFRHIFIKRNDLCRAGFRQFLCQSQVDSV